MIPELFASLLDDAAIFPPGLLPLPGAVSAHRIHRCAPFGEIVGPLVIGASVVDELVTLLHDWPHDPLELIVTAPSDPTQVSGALQVLADLPVRVCGLEIAVPADISLAAFFTQLDTLADSPAFVEIPRDLRRDEVLACCAATGHLAKFRTGGVRGDLYPDERELAADIRAALDTGVPFKATAGLHHAVRNTDPATGFEQHGFLNLLLLIAAIRRGAPEQEQVAILADRDATRIASRTAGLGPEVRLWFRSFGTCSVTDPLNDLIDLGLLPRTLAVPAGVTR